MYRNSLTLAILAATMTIGSAQQTTRPTPAPTPAPTPTPTPTPGRTTTPTPSQQPQQTPFPTDQPRPIFLSGKLVLDDGNPPPEPVMIERVCGTRVIQEGYTDSKGRFSIELGRNRTMFMDASSSSDVSDRFGDLGGGSRMGGPNGGVTERSLMGCELRANLAGFRSESVNLSSRRSLDNPEIGTIILHRLANVEGLTISATSLSAPKEAKKAFDKGRESAKKGKLDDAARNFDKAVELYPKYAVAWYERGRVYEAQNKMDEAQNAYGEALKIDAKLITPYERLVGMAVQKQNWQDAADTSARMIRLNPVDFPQAYLFNALANINLKNIDEAEKSASELIKMDPQHRFAKAEHMMAVIQANKQNWEAAAKHFRSYIQYAPPNASGLDLAKKQLADVEKTLAAQNTERQN